MYDFVVVFLQFDASERSVVMNEPWSPYSLSPISSKSEKLLRSPKKPTRRISKVPFKVVLSAAFAVSIVVYCNNESVCYDVLFLSMQLYTVM